MAMSRRKPFALAFSPYLLSVPFLFSRKKQRRPSFIRRRNECARDCAPPFSFFWLEGLFLTGTLGDYLMEVEHAGMSGIGESHGGWHRTGRCGGMERRMDGRTDGRVDEEEGLGTTDVPESPSAGPPSVTWRFLEGQLNI